MKHIYVNLKRFDVPAALGGVNRIAPPDQWARTIVTQTEAALAAYAPQDARFTMFFPEAHLLPALAAREGGDTVSIGCQGVYQENVSQGGNFGAFTAQRPAAAMRALGCGAAIIGHCEERRAMAGLLAEAGVESPTAINRVLGREILCAAQSGLSVLYCIGETEAEQPRWQAVLAEQLDIGLAGVDTRNIVIAYEPVWSIGPGKTPADRAYIQKVAQFVKSHTRGLPVVYGGGLKADNAAMLASIPEIDGGLIALTRFSGEIGFFPDEFLTIVKTYLDTAAKEAQA